MRYTLLAVSVQNGHAAVVSFRNAAAIFFRSCGRLSLLETADSSDHIAILSPPFLPSSFILFYPESSCLTINQFIALTTSSYPSDDQPRRYNMT